MIEAHVVSESKDQIIRRQQQIIRRQQQENEQLKNKIRQESSLWHTKENSDRTNMQEKAAHMHRLETLDNILSLMRTCCTKLPKRAPNSSNIY